MITNLSLDEMIETIGGSWKIVIVDGEITIAWEETGSQKLQP